MDIIADELKLNNDAVALLLVKKIQELNLSDSTLYYNFPFYRGETTTALVQAHILLVSREFGVMFFRCIDEKVAFTEEERAKIDDLDGHIFSKINKYDAFRIERRVLKINITPSIFIGSENEINEDIYVGSSFVREKIINNKKDILTSEEFSLLTSVIEGTVNIKQTKVRNLENSDTLTKGKVLSIIQNKEAVFDVEQKKAALNIIDSPQRIRGLAGSGKTIILTMKAALYHLQNPEVDVLYTYFTKSLFGQIRYLIEKYYRDFSENREPNWDRIHILHGWGGQGLRGVYSDTCFENNIVPVSFPEAKRNNNRDPFSYIFQELDKVKLRAKYDLTLIDEGQDFPQAFYRVCRKITRNDRIVWAYDDFQNIFDVDIQDEKETFGKNEAGEYYIDFSKNTNKLQDIILHRCYRNPRFALLNAFALGLGIYNSRVLQRLENNKHWEDLGFFVENGNSKNGDQMIISRPAENSPIETNQYFNEESVQIKAFNSFENECNYVITAIERDIRQQRLKPDDICVISIDTRNIGRYFENIETGLTQRGIPVFNLLNAANNNKYFSISDHVTLATINKAKGNETGMVYVIGVDSVFKHKDYIIDRNKLFTAITRSKGWVVITGLEQAALCAQEMDQLKINNYKLIFNQPSKEDTKTILRGMTQQQEFLNTVAKKIEEFSKNSGLTQEQIVEIIMTQAKDKK